MSQTLKKIGQAVWTGLWILAVLTIMVLLMSEVFLYY